MRIKQLAILCLIFISLHGKKIALLTVATGRYIDFVAPLISSAKKFFCNNHELSFFVFTDQKTDKREGVTFLSHKRLGWPYDTMMRVSVYDTYKEAYKGADFVFACDADMLFVDYVKDEVLYERVGTLHPGFFHKRGSYETRKASVAYVGPQEGKHYFAGGFYGGSYEEFCKINTSLLEMIERDKKNNMVAIWHDESYLNRYFIDSPPTKILTPDYCFPDKASLTKTWKIEQFKGKLLALTKDHEKCRK